MKDKYYKLEQLRTEKGYSVKKMADLLNISKTFYWQIENKKRSLSYIMAIKIATVLKTKPDKIFYDETKQEN